MANTSISPLNVSTLSQHKSGTESLLRTQADLQKVSNAKTSGYNTDEYAGTDGQAGHLLDIDAELASGQRYSKNSQLEDQRLGLIEVHILNLHTTLAEFRQQLSSEINDPNKGMERNLTGVSATYLTDIERILNSKDKNGRPLFGGEERTNPVDVSELPVLNPGDAVSYTYYSGTTNTPTFVIGEGETFSHGITAGGEAVGKMLSAIKIASVVKNNTDADRVKLQYAMDLAAEATEKLSSMVETIGQQRGILQDKQEFYTKTEEFLTKNRSDIIDTSLVKSESDFQMLIMQMKAGMYTLAAINKFSMENIQALGQSSTY